MTYTARFRRTVGAFATIFAFTAASPLNSRLLQLIAGILLTIGAAGATAQIGDAVDFAKLYPRTKEEIRAGLKEIEQRMYQMPAAATGKAAKLDARLGMGLQKGINELNTYRFLSGVPHNVVLDPELVAAAQEAAEACKAAGHISHDLGHFTENCNLTGRPGSPVDNPQQIRGYINDDGENNRVVRGHRMWCLNPQLAKTGFGLSGGFGALHCHDRSGPERTESWAYPGKGWYPRERLHGDSWSIYLTADAPPAADVKVRMWKLLRAPKEALQNPSAPVGREIKIKATFTNKHWINFEPEITAGKDTYWISVEGPGVSEKYLVDLF